MEQIESAKECTILAGDDIVETKIEKRPSIKFPPSWMIM